MRSKIKIVIILISLALAPARSQVLSLDSILNTIDANNPELKMYEEQIKSYDTYAEGARALEAPQVGGGFFMTPYNTSMWNPDVMSGSNGMGSFMLSAQQMINNPKELSANAKYMQGMSAIDKQMKNASRNELYSMAKMSYYEWMVLKKKIGTLTESESVLAYLIKSAELRYTYGMDKLNSYYKAKAMLGDIQNMKVMTQLEMKEQQINLNTLMNRNKDQVFDVDTLYSIQNYENAVIDTTSISSSRSDYKAIDQNINLLRAKQQYEQSKRLPDFGVKYDHMLAFGTQPQQFSLMAMITIPIAPWSSKMYRSTVKGLNFEIEAVKKQQRSLVNRVAGNLQKLKEQIKSKKQQLELYEKTILPSMKRNYETTQLAYEQNTGELFMALDAWQNLKVAQMGYLDQLKELLLLQVEFENQLEIK